MVDSDFKLAKNQKELANISHPDCEAVYCFRFSCYKNFRKEIIFMNNNNIFIAGAGGMLGKALSRMLKDKGCNNLLTPSRKELNLLSADVSEYFSSNKIDTVIFLAAKVGGIQTNILNPVGFFMKICKWL